MSGPGNITHKPTGYPISAGRVLETTERGGVEYLSWPLHMRETKEWVFLPDFRLAFEEAVRRRLKRQGHAWPQFARMIEEAFAYRRPRLNRPPVEAAT